MSGRCLLDTNIIIAIFARDQAVIERLTEAEEALVPIIALDDLYYGARKSSRIRENLERIDELRAKGRLGPENDIWISASAIQHGLTVATRDDHHFSQISGLNIEAW